MNNEVKLPIEKVRVSMEAFGSLYGKRIFTVISENADPKFIEKMRTNALRLSSPLRKFSVKAIDVTSLNAQVDASGALIVIINNDPDLRCPVTKPEFKEVSVATVREAIEAHENKSGTIYFTDCDAVTKEVIALNAAERAKANDLTKELAAMTVMYGDLIDVQKESRRRYYEELNQQLDADVTVNVTVQ